jgi:curved DNA-binding protein CbpA
MFSNPYSALGVANGTSKEDCKKAWRTLSRKYHPDNGGDKDKFDEVQKAWQAIDSGACIINVIKRKSLKHSSLFSFV